MTEDDRPDRGEDAAADSPEPDNHGSQPEVAATPPAKRFRAATDDELDPQSFIVADDRAALRAVLRGGSIASDRGDAEFIGNAVRRLARTLHESANRFRHGTGAISIPLLRRLEFGHSVEIDLGIGDDEDVQMDTANRPHSPTIDAAAALIDLFAAEPDDLIARALDFPSDAVSEYRQLLNLLAGDNVTLEWQSPLRPEQVVQYSSVDARRDYAILDRPGEPRTDEVHVPGTLTMADSRRHRFELTLPSDLNRPPLLKGKQTVQGTYSEDMGHHLKDEGLWDSEVMATIQVTYDAPGSTPLPRDPEFTLVAAEPLMRTTPMFN